MRTALKWIPILMSVSALYTAALAHAEDPIPPTADTATPNHPHHPHMHLTDEQKTCLEGKVGKPGQGERASREKMDAALKECKIPHPPQPQGKPPTAQDGQSGE